MTEPQKLEYRLTTLLFQAASEGTAAVVFTFDNRKHGIVREKGLHGVTHYSVPRKPFIKSVLENKV